MSDFSDAEEYVQYPQNLIEAYHKVYRYLENNEKYVKVKHLDQFYAKYWCSLKHHCVTAKFIFSIDLNQVENERGFSISGVFSRAPQLSLTIKNLAMLIFIKKITIL